MVLTLAIVGMGFFARASTPPNILLIVSDDQGYSDLGCMGTRPVMTPHLDALAANGVRATSFYVTCPACTPSRGSILTGRYPQRNGLYDLVRNNMVDYGHLYTVAEYATSPEMTLGLDPRERTLGDVLRRAGYRTGVVGKWDMGQAKRFLPLQRGFDFFYGFGNNDIDYYTHERYGIPSMMRGNELTQADKGTYATDLFKREALRFISESRSRPWFLYLGFNAPHSASTFAVESAAPAAGGKPRKRPPGVGVQVPEKYAALYREKVKNESLARYYGAITCMDEAIGEILTLIQQRGEARNTMVVFLSDNGGNGAESNAPLRGAKASTFEGGVRVPAIFSWPAALPAGKVSDDFICALDLFPTLAQAAKAKLDRKVTLDGFDILPVLRGDKPARRTEMFWQWRENRAARVGNWKWVDGSKGSGLFDLTWDLGEAKDLSQEHPEMAAKLQARFNAWRQEMNASEPRGPFRNY